MYFGAWYKSLYASSNHFGGYAAWILAGLEYEIALSKTDRLTQWDEVCSNAIYSLIDKMENKHRTRN